MTLKYKVDETNKQKLCGDRNCGELLTRQNKTLIKCLTTIPVTQNRN